MMTCQDYVDYAELHGVISGIKKWTSDFVEEFNLPKIWFAPILVAILLLYWTLWSTFFAHKFIRKLFTHHKKKLNNILKRD